MKTEIHSGSSRRLSTSLRPAAMKLPWMLVWAATAASAQTALTNPARTLDSVPGELQYVSELGRYQPYVDQPLQSWREANDQVRRIGGWRFYAKEAAVNSTNEKPATTNPNVGSSEKGRP
ncbi:hypothetical protein [Simplicispira lacusdiani]|uniref:hypothetical protein n=1 Tax=Simplicispira lacusdiani TaxID=2213010 RepID=UPI00130085FA|nr:hypothetical protein [Simplicispira lacusdiani]